MLVVVEEFFFWVEGIKERDYFYDYLIIWRKIQTRAITIEPDFRDC